MTAGTARPLPTAGAGSLASADLARYAAAAAAAEDPELLLGPATDAFADIRSLLLAGDWRGADGAALAVQDLCLQLCASMAASARASDDKCKFLAIMVGWAWPRVPAVGAVLDASRAQELALWGPSAAGSG